MRFFYLFIALCVTTQVVWGQSTKIDSLTKVSKNQRGEAFLRTAVQLADLTLTAGDWNASAKWADKIVEVGLSVSKKEYAAQGYHSKGKALRQSRKRNLYSKAQNAFEDSNEVTNQKDLKKANWLALADLAKAMDKPVLLQESKTALAILNGQKVPESSEDNRVFGKKKRMLASAQQEAALAQEALSNTRQNLQKMERNLENQEATMSAAIAIKQRQLKEMDAAQIEQAFLLMEQNRLLDSLEYVGMMDSLLMAKQSTNLAQKELLLQQQTSELAFQHQQRKLWMAILALLIALAGGLFWRYLSTKKHNAVLAEKNEVILAEKQRSEELLLNILPLAVANELKMNGSAEAQFYDQATVLFTDFKGFSTIAQQLSPDALVAALDEAFRAFDKIVVHHGLEKIKTIGDAYMCAGGLPGRNETHPAKVVQAALDIQVFLSGWNSARIAQGQPPFEARVGIHTGPLVAGVVGSKKFAYDIWGDTVNIASRMESSSETGEVNISAYTYELVKHTFRCIPRGFIEAKNIGSIEMFYVEGKA